MKPIHILLAAALALTPAVAAEAKGGKSFKGHKAAAIHGKAKGHKAAKWHKKAKKQHRDVYAGRSWEANSAAALSRRDTHDPVERELRRLVSSRIGGPGLEDLLVGPGLAGVLGGLALGQGLYPDLYAAQGVLPAPGDRLIARPQPLPGDRLIGRVVPGRGDVYFDDEPLVTRRDYGVTVIPRPGDYYNAPDGLTGPEADLPPSALAPLTSPSPRRSIFREGDTRTASRDGTITVAPLGEGATPGRSTPQRFAAGDEMPADYVSRYVVLDDLERFALPPNPPDTDYVRVENDAVLVNRADRRVREVLPLGTLMIR